VVLTVFAVRVIVSIVIASSPVLIRTFDGDAIIYHRGAVSILQHWDAGQSLAGVPIAAGKEGFYYLLAALYYVFGTYQVAGLVVNAALGAALLPVLHDTTRRLFGSEAAKVAVLVAAVLPSFLIWTSQLLREAPVLFLLALTANMATRLVERTTLGAYAVLGASLALLFTLRANVALVAAAGFMVGLVFGRDRLLAGVATGATTAGFAAALVVAGGIGYTGFQASTGADLQQVSLARQDLARSAVSGYSPNKDVSSTGKAINFLPVALPNFALGPFPWQARNVVQVGGVLEALSLWVLFPSLWRGVRSANAAASRQWYVLAGPAIILTLSLSLLVGNFGMIVRERLQVTVLLVPFVGFGWALRRRRRVAKVGHDEKTQLRPVSGW
jgi:4-amino-4-deoxy-L-arabinose transferase-like glycosyltransferase